MRLSEGAAAAIRWGAAGCNFNATESASARQRLLIFLGFRAPETLPTRVRSRTPAALVQARCRLGTPNCGPRRKGRPPLQMRRIVQAHAVASDRVAHVHDAWRPRQRRRSRARRSQKKRPAGCGRALRRRRLAPAEASGVADQTLGGVHLAAQPVLLAPEAMQLHLAMQRRSVDQRVLGGEVDAAPVLA